jgi:nucleotide-binding universal stress UspA family protein
MEIKRVVIGTDFSDSSVAAARWTAAHFAKGAEVVLVHSIFVPTPPGFLRGRFPAPELVIATAREGAEKRLHALAKSLAPTAIQTEVRVGPAAEQIATVAKEHAADLVVVGKHGQRAGIWSRLGTTAERLVTNSPAPVLVIPKVPAAVPKNVLVALEDPEEAGWVLDWLRYVVERFGARATALHVVSSAILAGVLSVASDGPFHSEEVKSEIRGQSDQWRGRFQEAGVAAAAIDSELTFGEPGQEIVAAADRLRSDLIVLGRERGGRARRALLGSVTDEVLRAANCPVLVVPESDGVTKE